jgi:FtsP/CotA-like multicopper oxidase with cupredoxin domain
MTYMTVCFEGHTALIIAADVTPVEEVAFDDGCVDINSGQRYDISVTANQPEGLYWISVHSQYQGGSPSAYAVLRYSEVRPPTRACLPAHPPDCQGQGPDLAPLLLPPISSALSLLHVVIV